MYFASRPWTRMGLMWWRLGSGSLVSSQRMLWLWSHRKFKDSQNFRTGSELKPHPMHASAPSYASIYSAKSFIYSTNISWAPTVCQVLRADSEPNRQISLPSWSPHSSAMWLSYLCLHKWMRSGARTALPGTGLISTRLFPPLKQHTPFCISLAHSWHVHWAPTQVQGIYLATITYSSFHITHNDSARKIWCIPISQMEWGHSETMWLSQAHSVGHGWTKTKNRSSQLRSDPVVKDQPRTFSLGPV